MKLTLGQAAKRSKRSKGTRQKPLIQANVISMTRESHITR